MRSCVKDQQPFLAVVWFGSPHDPHIALEKDRQLYADQPEALQDYYGEITAMDRSIGMIRDALRRLSVGDNTILWYTSDNGPQGPLKRNRPGSSGGLRDRKGTLWKGGIRVPAIIEWPACKSNSKPGNNPSSAASKEPTMSRRSIRRARVVTTRVEIARETPAMSLEASSASVAGASFPLVPPAR